MSDLTPMQMLEIECKKALAECVRLGKELHASRRETIELRAAARALLTALPFETAVCLKHRGHELATKVMRFEPPYAGSYFVCDECAPVGANDLRLAAPVRRLRALLEVKP